MAPEESRDLDVSPKDPRDAEDEWHGGDHVRGESEDDEKERPHDAHHLQSLKR